MAGKKPKLTKDEEKSNKTYEKKLRSEVDKIQAVDKFLAQGEGELKSFADLEAWYKRFKAARGEDYKKGQIQERSITLPGGTKGGSNKKT